MLLIQNLKPSLLENLKIEVESNTNKQVYKFPIIDTEMLQKTSLLFVIFIVSFLMAVAFGFLNYKYKKRVIDYYVMFLIGIGWTILSLLFKILSLGIMGAAFAILGYLKRKEWDEDLTGMRKANRDELTLLKEQTDSLELAFTLLIFIGILILIGVIIYMYLVKVKFSGA